MVVLSHKNPSYGRGVTKQILSRATQFFERSGYQLAVYQLALGIVVLNPDVISDFLSLGKDDLPARLVTANV